MKITIFGLTISSSWGNGHATPYRALLKALHRQGHSTTFYEKDVDYYRGHRDMPECDFCELILYPDWQSIRKKALAEAADSDVVIVGSYCPEGARISGDVLELCSPIRVFYDLDTPVTLTNLACLDYLTREQMPEFDLYLSFTGGQILRELEDVYGVQRARALYGCVDPEVHKRVPPRHQFRCDLSYMGTYAPDRQHKVETLFLETARQMPDAQFLLAGSLYPWPWNFPVSVRKLEHVEPSEHPALYSSSRVTLNITRDGMASRGYCPSGRFFEAAACGTPIASDWFEGLDGFFHDREEIFVVRTTEDVLGVLLLSDEELERTAQRALDRTLTEHTGDCRARELVQFLEEARWALGHSERTRDSLEARS